MSKLTSVLLSVIFLALVSCKNEEKPSDIKKPEVENKIETVNSDEIKLSLSSFSKIPEEIDGCSCIFSETEKEYEKRKYIFVSNFDSIAFVSVNNKIEKLNITERVYKQNTIENEDYTCIYKTENYKVTIKIEADKTKEDSDEAWWNKGSITIENKNGEKLTKKFIGESGC